MSIAIKRTLYSLLLLGTFSASFVQATGPLFKPSKITHYDPTAGTYRTFFAEDNTYREFFKQQGDGWLDLSVFTENDTLEKVVQNTFQGNLLTKIQTDEKEMDAKGSLQRTTTKVHNAMPVYIN